MMPTTPRPRIDRTGIPMPSEKPQREQPDSDIFSLMEENRRLRKALEQKLALAKERDLAANLIAENWQLRKLLKEIS